MTNKSIGNFLAELRKEKGLTQKEVADFLNVSDKTVSHWECDKYSPDISVIPILAEFFGVTCDEILRGERKSPEGNEINFSYEPLDKQSEYAEYTKIRLQNTYNKLKLNSLVAVFLSLFMHALLFVAIELIDEHIAIADFDFYAANISAIFSVALGAIIIFSSHIRFMNILNMCDFAKSERNKWKRKAISLYILPLILFMVICLTSAIALMPVNHDYSDAITSTMGVPHSIDASEDPSLSENADPIIRVPTSMTSDSGATQYADTSEEVNIFD